MARFLNIIVLLCVLFISNTSYAQGVYGVFGLPPGTNPGEKQIGTINPTSGVIGLLGTNTSVDPGALAMTTGATALNVNGNKSYFIGRNTSNEDRIYTVDLNTGVTDTNPVLTATYTTSNNWGIWYDEPNAVVYAIFDRGSDVELAIINPATGAVTQQHSAIVGSGAGIASGLLTGDSAGERVFFLADSELYIVSTTSTDTAYLFDLADISQLLNTSNIYGLEWDSDSGSLWILHHEDLGNRKVSQLMGEDNFNEGDELFINTSITLDNDNSITTASGLSALDLQSSTFFFIGRPSVGANAGKWSLYSVDLVNETSSNADIENPSLVQTNGYAGIEVLPGPVLSFGKTDGDISSTPGGTITYTLNYSNAVGSGATSGLKITETVPAETQFLPGSSTAGWVCAPDNLAGSICEISPTDIGPGGSGSVTFAIQVNAYVTSGLTQIDNSATISATNAKDSVIATDFTPITATTILAVTKTDNDVTDKIPGDTITYQIKASNTGNRIADNVVLTETVPTNTTLNPGFSAGWVCLPDNTSGSSCTNTIGNLAGTAFDTDFAVDVIASVPALTTQISNTVVLSADSTPSAQASDTTPITSAAVLNLLKNDGNATAIPGDSVIYQLDYSNTGNQDADSVVISETVLSETQFDAANSTPGWVCIPDNLPASVCTFNIGTLGGGANGIANFALVLDDPVSALISELSNTAVIDATNATAANGADTTPIDASVELRMVKNDGDVTAALSKVITYSLINFNDGNRDAVDVELTETVPAETEFYPLSSTPGWNCLPDNTAGSTCTYLVGDLAGGGKSQVFFAVKVNETVNPAVTELTNTASIAASNAASDAEDTETTPIDTIFPTITLVDANPSINEISQCSQNDQAINQIQVAFEDDNDGMIGIDNLNNFALIDTGIDQDLQSTDCNTILGDDIAINIDSLSISGTPTNPISTLDLVSSLSESVYFLMVCDQITDAAGNSLDGDDDGIQGGNLARQFRIANNNLFENAFLDDCEDAPIMLPPWLAIGADVVSEIDFDNSSLSGAVELFSVDGSAVGITQCADVTADRNYSVETSLIGSPFQIGDLEVNITCEFSDLPNCASITKTHEETFTLAASVTPVWDRIESEMLAPLSATSVMCSISISSPDNNLFASYLDELELRNNDIDVMFKDGFESVP